MKVGDKFGILAKGKKKADPPKKIQNDTISEPTSNPESKRILVSCVVFVFSVSVVLLSIISVIFPALIQSTYSEFKELNFYSSIVNPFETGVLAIPFLVINFVLLVFGILYYKKRWTFERLFNFDISKKISLIIIVMILIIYIAVTISEFGTPEPWPDLARVENTVINTGIENLQGFDLYVRYALLTVSYDVFGDMRIIPFIGSILLLVTTYFFTKEITQKRIAGIFAFILVLQSNIFLTYDTSATYSNFWILFYLASLYLVLRKWQLSHISFILSMFSKSITAVFLPMTMFFVLNNTNSKTRIYLAISYGVLIIVGIGVLSNSNILFGSSVFLPENFWKGFESFSYQLRFDPIILIFLLPLTVSLFLKSRKGFYQANSIMVLISGLLLIPPLLITFTTQTNEPYRLMPLVVFFSIGAATLLAKIKQDE